jgi:general stress protein 26
MALTDSVARLNELLQGIDLAILTTVRPDTSLHSCPMAVGPIDANAAFWLIARDNSEKVEAVRTAPRVNLSFSAPAADCFVSVSGFCELVRDRNRIKELWHPYYTSWFPGGSEDPALVLMKIVVEEAEYWDAAQSRMVTLTGFNPASKL